MTIYTYVAACPRCDRAYKSNTSFNDALELVRTHVAGQHPDHDPQWFETYPEPVVSDFTNTRQGETL